jgi:hypothetical protein
MVRDLARQLQVGAGPRQHLVPEPRPEQLSLIA